MKENETDNSETIRHRSRDWIVAAIDHVYDNGPQLAWQLWLIVLAVGVSWGSMTFLRHWEVSMGVVLIAAGIPAFRLTRKFVIQIVFVRRGTNLLAWLKALSGLAPQAVATFIFYCACVVIRARLLTLTLPPYVLHAIQQAGDAGMLIVLFGMSGLAFGFFAASRMVQDRSRLEAHPRFHHAEIGQVEQSRTESPGAG